MSILVRDAFMSLMGHLRHEPLGRRLRATRGGATVVDTERGLLVWEPRRIVPSYAVPVDDVRGALVPGAPAELSDRPLLHPGIPFDAHSTPGTVYGIDGRDGIAFRPLDATLAGYVVLDFEAFDAWHEEDEAVFSHPRDPYSRIETKPSSRHVRVERDGVLLAESTRPVLLFESILPVRYYLPRDDVRAEARPSATTTRCAYKGEANYLSFDVGEDLAWYYVDPLNDAVPVRGLVSFYNEVVDITVDGVKQPRPGGPVAEVMVEEFNLPV